MRDIVGLTPVFSKFRKPPERPNSSSGGIIGEGFLSNSSFCCPNNIVVERMNCDVVILEHTHTFYSPPGSPLDGQNHQDFERSQKRLRLDQRNYFFGAEEESESFGEARARPVECVHGQLVRFPRISP